MGISSPAVIVIGSTAALELLDRKRMSLEGVRVGLTGTPAFSAKLEEAFRRKGAVTVPVMRSSVVPLGVDIERLTDGKRRWLVFTSANGVRTFFSMVRRERTDLRRFSEVKFAVIGKPTGGILEEHGFSADLCPGTFTSEELGKALALKAAKDEEIVLLRADNATDTLPSLLRTAGFTVTEEKIYSVVPEDAEDGPAMQDLDYITFGSAGGVRAFFEGGRELPPGVKAVAIGKITAGELEKHTGCAFLVAEKADAEAITAAVEADRN